MLTRQRQPRSGRDANAMAATRAFAVLCLVSAARAGPKVKKPPKVELDESKLPPLESVLAELGVADVLPQLQAKGLDSTRQLCKWSRSDVSIHGMELGWSRDLQKEVLDKIAALVAGAAKAAEAVVVDELAALRDERNNLTYGRVYVDRSSASFEYRRAWFGARLPESPLPMVMAAPRNGCAPLPPAIVDLLRRRGVALAGPDGFLPSFLCACAPPREFDLCERWFAAGEVVSAVGVLEKGEHGLALAPLRSGGGGPFAALAKHAVCRGKPAVLVSNDPVLAGDTTALGPPGAAKGSPVAAAGAGRRVKTRRLVWLNSLAVSLPFFASLWLLDRG